MIYTGLQLTLVGMTAVAGSLLLLIFCVKILTFTFPVKKEKTPKQPVSKKSDDPEEILSSIPPDEVLALVAVEHYRRQIQLGSRLEKRGAK